MITEMITDQNTADAYDQLRNTVRKYIDHSAYNTISFIPLAALFGKKQEPEDAVLQIEDVDPFTLDIEDLDL